MNIPHKLLKEIKEKNLRTINGGAMSPAMKSWRRTMVAISMGAGYGCCGHSKDPNLWK